MCTTLKGGIRGIVKRAAVIGNGVAGAGNQCIGLIRALGLSDQYTLHRVRRPAGGVNKCLYWLPVSFHQKVDEFSLRVSDVFRSRMDDKNKKLVPVSAQENGAIDIIPEADARSIGYKAQETSQKDGPLLVVASGQDTAPVANSIKKLAPEFVFVVQIQHPRMKLNKFDLIITPHHYFFHLSPHGRRQVPWFLRRWITPEPPDKHVVLTIGTLHHADPAALQVAAATWHAAFAHLAKPLLVVLKIIVRELRDHPKVYIWDSSGQNPHLANLAWADAFVITADSVSMLSEACSTGKPVYVVGAELCTWTLADFHKSLFERGATKPFTGREDVCLFLISFTNMLMDDGILFKSIHHDLADLKNLAVPSTK